jgi:hypothetical protein
VAVGAVIARIITQYSDKGSKAAARDINKLGKSFDKFAGKVGKAFAIGAAAAGAFAVKIGVDSVKAAIADEKSQALLANSLRNTTGATDAAIAATEAYIDQTQRAFGVVDDELRPALAKLASMTGSVAAAQGLLGLAMDVSAGGSVDLNAATNAVTKALQGNYKALKNLGVPITDAMVKSKDLNAVLALTAKTFGGAAATRAGTFEFRMKRLNIAFEEAKETLGNALMPVMEELFTILVTKVIPAIQKFLEENGDKLVAAFTAAIKAVVGFGFVIFKVFSFVAKNKTVFIALGAIFTATFVASKVMAFVTAIVALVKAYKAIRAAALAAAAAQAAATGGISVAAAVAGVAAFTATLGGLYLAVSTANGAMDKLETTGTELEFSFDGLSGTTDDFLKSLKGMNIDLGKAGKQTKALTKEQKLLIGLQAAIKKLSGSAATTETDPIQLEAARLNLVKQNNFVEAERIALLLKSKVAAEEAAIAAQRYTDILMALADAKIVPAEFELLAVKWGITTNAVRLYTEAIVSIQDSEISAGDIANLAEQWGVTYKQASLYLGFFQALNDGTLSDKEIANLQTQWGFTNKQVKDYSLVFAAADDGKIDYSEIVGLADKWGMTTDEAEAYAKKILEDFGFNIDNLNAPISVKKAWEAAYGSAEAYDKLLTTAIVVDPSLIEPGNTAAKAWKAAYDQALEYKNLVAKKAFDNANPPATLAEKAYAEYLNGLQAKADAAAAAQAKADAIIQGFADAASGDTYLKGRYGPGSGLTAPGFIPGMANGGVVTSPTIAMIGEAGPEAVIPLGQMGSMGGATVNITINGSVTSEGDLVNTIRNALLQGQNNGQLITKTAIQL